MICIRAYSNNAVFFHCITVSPHEHYGVTNHRFTGYWLFFFNNLISSGYQQRRDNALYYMPSVSGIHWPPVYYPTRVPLCGKGFQLIVWMFESDLWLGKVWNIRSQVWSIFHRCHHCALHYSDVIMSAMTSQITGVSIFFSNVCWGADQRKYQSSASLAFVRGIHRWPVYSLCWWPRWRHDMESLSISSVPCGPNPIVTRTLMTSWCSCDVIVMATLYFRIFSMHGYRSP